MLCVWCGQAPKKDQVPVYPGGDTAQDLQLPFLLPPLCVRSGKEIVCVWSGLCTNIPTFHKAISVGRWPDHTTLANWWSRLWSVDKYVATPSGSSISPTWRFYLQSSAAWSFNQDPQQMSPRNLIPMEFAYQPGNSPSSSFFSQVMIPAFYPVLKLLLSQEITIVSY